jgi:putative sensor protein/HAAS domain-containing protein
VSTQNATVEVYLQDLKRALKGADRAIVQDALADAEEHLRTAMASERESRKDVVESDLLGEVIRSYGSPEEIAEAYRTWDQSVPPALAKSSLTQPSVEDNRPRRYRGFFGVYADPRAWGGLVYMLISLITGTLYFSWAVTALSTSLGLMILIIGVPITILLLLSMRGLTFLEGRLVEALLGERMPRRPSFTDNSLGWIARLKQLLLGKSTWLGVLYMVTMLPLGVVYFTIAVVLLSLSLAFLATPIASIVFDLPVVMMENAVYYLPDWLSPLFALGGIVLATATLHLARWTGRTHGKLAKALLVSD